MSNANQPRLLSFTLDDWTALGEKVSVSLLDQVAVLVGRNGAGKSAILEGFAAISSVAVGNFRWPQQFDIDTIPKKLEIEILTSDERRLQYMYELIIMPASTEVDLDSSIDDPEIEIPEETILTYNETCQYMDESQELLWTTEVGTITVGNETSFIIIGSTSFLQQAKSDIRKGSPRLPKEVHWVYDVLNGVRLLGKIPIRQTYSRRQSLIQVSRKRFFATSGSLYREVDGLARKILRMRIEDIRELESICQRIGLGSTISIQKFILNEESKEKSKNENEEYVTGVSLDGVNIGLLSDGTLRVLSLLVALIASHSSVTTIVEEPETQIHPGMLAKLLSEIETYTFGQNLIFSTHSPQVVGWTTPDKINLVYREHGRTIIRKLNEEEIQKVVEYLYEEGDLGEWLYSGILDE